MGERLHSWWQQIKTHPVATILIALLVLVVVLLVLCILLGYIFNWSWTGLRQQTLWNWLQLLIIPAVIAIAGYLFTFTISRNERKAADKHNQTEREIALDNQREKALLEYIDKMSELLLHENLRMSKEDAEVRTIARVGTLTVLPSLDGGRKRSLLQFLYESGLIENDKTIIDLQGADLSGANLLKAYLPSVNLRGANLQEADLRGAKLQGANLCSVYLSGAKLNVADLRQTDLSYARLATTNQYGANFYGATLNTTVALVT